MARIKDENRQFWESANFNNRAFKHYYDRLVELSISMFEWKNLPLEIDKRFLELNLFSKGSMVFFRDEDIAITGNQNREGYLALPMAGYNGMDIYHIPIGRHAYAVNGYSNMDLNNDNSVIIYNNMLKTPANLDIEWFAKKLSDLDRIAEVNINAQRTPVLVLADENQRLTMKNMYKQYEGNEPFIFGSKKLDDYGKITVLKTDAPYLADKLYTLKTNIWNEALTYLGISNINNAKKERMITDEVTQNQGSVIASRYSRLESRREACLQIKELFGLDVWCDYREDFQEIGEEEDTYNGSPNSDGEGGEKLE